MIPHFSLYLTGWILDVKRSSGHTGNVSEIYKLYRSSGVLGHDAPGLTRSCASCGT